MAIDFPDAPTNGQVFTVGDRSWTWNGTYWKQTPATGPQGPQGATGAQGATGPQGATGTQGAEGAQFGTSLYFWSVFD